MDEEVLDYPLPRHFWHFHFCQEKTLVFKFGSGSVGSAAAGPKNRLSGSCHKRSADGSS